MNWMLFGMLAVVSYIAISFMAQMTGGSATSAVDSVLRLFHPYVLLASLVGSLLGAVALYYGFKESRDALPILLAIGVLVGFVYSVLFLRDAVTVSHLLGIVLVLMGIYFLA